MEDVPIQDIEAEIIAALTQEISEEIDEEILVRLRRPNPLPRMP